MKEAAEEIEKKIKLNTNRRKNYELESKMKELARSKRAK